VGTAPSSASARRGRYFSHPTNRFWALLHESGLTDLQLRPEDDADVLRYELGLTDVMKNGHGSNDRLLDDAALFAGVPTLREKVRAFAPNTLCFISKKAFRVFFGYNPLTYGRQPVRIETAAVWVVPSPSGRVSSHRLLGGRTRLDWFRLLAESA
jgi:double-stranded uracil-DNA glycosylase